LTAVFLPLQPRRVTQVVQNENNTYDGEDPRISSIAHQENGPPLGAPLSRRSRREVRIHNVRGVGLSLYSIVIRVNVKGA